MAMNWKEDLTPLMDGVLASGTESRFDDFHSVVTIQFGELIEAGFDWGKKDYCPDLSNKHRERLNQKIEDRYYYREICEVPPGKFKLFLKRKLNEIVPKYKLIYDQLDAGNGEILRKETYNGKERRVFSEFPQAQLKGTNDYATNANDTADGHTLNGAPIEMFVDLHERYDDVDVMIWIN